MSPLARYTRFVRTGRLVLWGLIALVLLTLLWIGTERSDEDGARLVFSNNTKPTDAGQSVMANPRYQGLDDKNQPYTIFADTAVQKDDDTVVLTNIRSEIAQHDGTWLALNAAAGEANLKARQIDLSGGVELFTDGGYAMRTARAHVDIAKGEVVSNVHVEGQGPTGTLEADRFLVIDRGARIRFNGSVRMILYPKSR